MLVTQLFKHWTYQVFAPGTLLRRKYEAFKSLLRHDAIALELIADLEELFYGENWLTVSGQLACRSVGRSRADHVRAACGDESVPLHGPA